MVDPRLERIAVQLNGDPLKTRLFDRIFCGKPVSTFPENAPSGPLHAAVFVRKRLRRAEALPKPLESC
jgi:hypothetical protein